MLIPMLFCCLYKSRDEVFRLTGVNILFAALCTYSTLTYAQPKAPTYRLGETIVHIKVKNIFLLRPQQAPMPKLAMALKQYKTSSKFRVTWHSFASSMNIGVTAIYNRRTNTLKYYSSGSFFEKRVREHYLYTNVTDKVIFKIASKHQKAEESVPDDAFFSELSKYGCKRKRLP